jgi:branched-chain amino acid transport system ATP-binding protein/urea transport system ATP-binding protein
VKLEIENLVVGYVRGSHVLDGLSLEVDTGEAVALLGRNGMGKSTLLRTIAGHLRPSAGEIRLDGRRLDSEPPYRVARAGVGYVPQGRDIFADFTVEENLRVGVLGRGRLGAAIPDWAFAFFPILGERRRQLAGTLSGGQQQQLAIVRALVGMPQLLLLDEPSEGIQPSIVHDIGARLKRYLGERALSLLLVEQNLDLVASLASRVLFVENGRIVESVTDIGRLMSDEALVHRYLSV